jgi:hypothetical protein
VVKDASAGNDHDLPATADGGHSDGHVRGLDEPTRNLTQELAQLLAASIAQARRGEHGSVPTNSDLASLASIVSAASGQRTLAPVFKDGLSALSYTPHPKPAPAPLDSLDLAQDDEPMPIPSTWREPRLSDDDRWYRQQLGAAVLGLVAGLMIVVPAVMWLSGFFDPQKAKPPAAGPVASAPREAKPAQVRTVKVQPQPVEKPVEATALSATGSIEPRPPAARPQPPPPAPSPTMAAARLVEPTAHVDEALAQAARQIESGNVGGARELLAGIDDDARGAVAFALAETFDPNMLAAWGTRGVAADVAKARAFYSKALRHGMAPAQVRLDALK